VEHTLILNNRYVERRIPALGKEFHQVCSCGWQGPWKEDETEAKRQRCPKAQPVVVGGA